MAGIIRWLERFQNSYRSGALENALMDAECARADIEDLRLDIWSRVGPARSRRSMWGTIAYGMLPAFLIVLTTAVPLSKPSVPIISTPITAVEAMEITPARGDAAAKPLTEVARKHGTQKKGSPAARKAASIRSAPPTQGSVRTAEKKVPYDEMFSLLQMGAHALKNEEPAIKIQKIGKGEGKL